MRSSKKPVAPDASAVYTHCVGKMIAKAYKTRLYPSPLQEEYLRQWGNGCRGLWNLETRNASHTWLDANIDHETEGRWMDDGGPVGRPVYHEERRKAQYNFVRPDWASEVPATAAGEVRRHYATAVSRFAKGKAGPPRTKKKTESLSISMQNVRFVSDDHIVMPVVASADKEIKALLREPMRLAEPLGARLRAGRPGRRYKNKGKTLHRPAGWKGVNGDVCTITRCGGKWFASFPAINHHPRAPREEQLAKRGQSSVAVLGVDINCEPGFVCSDGTRHERPDWSRDQAGIKDAQRRVSSCVRGSARRRKAVLRLAKRQARLARKRDDWQHKAAYDIVSRADVIVLEDLQTKNMTKRAKGKGRAAKSGLNREILSSAPYAFRTKVTTKAEALGKRVVLVPAPYTSQDCSGCGARDPIGTYRDYKCGACGLEIDRDVNAAINIRNKFLSTQGTGEVDARSNDSQASINSGDTNAADSSVCTVTPAHQPPHASAGVNNRGRSMLQRGPETGVAQEGDVVR